MSHLVPQILLRDRNSRASAAAAPGPLGSLLQASQGAKTIGGISSTVKNEAPEEHFLYLSLNQINLRDDICSLISNDCMNGYVLFSDEILHCLTHENGKMNECGSDGCKEAYCKQRKCFPPVQILF